MTSLPWETGLQSWQSCTIALAYSVGYKWRFCWDPPQFVANWMCKCNGAWLSALETSLLSWQSCTIALAHSVGYKWRSYWDSPSEGLISYMWIQSDSDLTNLINFQGVCVTRLMCSPLAGNFWSTPVSVHKGWYMVSWLLCLGRLVSKANSHAPLHLHIQLATVLVHKGLPCVTRLMCSPLASNFWSTPVLVHKGLIHGVINFSAMGDWSPKPTVMHHCTCTFSWLQMEVLPRFPLRRFDQLYVGHIRQWSHRFNPHITDQTFWGGFSVEPPFIANWTCKCNGAWLSALETRLPRQRSHDTMY